MARAVPFNDLTRIGDDERRELEDAFARVARSGRLVLGPEVETFEARAATRVGARHAVGVSSGTDALIAAWSALGVGPGDEVVCPTYSFVATAHAIVRVGATPVFVDSDESFNVDPRAAAAAITGRTRAVVVVHLFGRCANVDPIVAAARDADIPVVEDAAQAFGAEYDGRPAGALGTIACFSFFPTKNLGALGDGGLVTTNDDHLARRLRALRSQGGTEKHRYDVVGGNFRLDALQAALLGVRLSHLDQRTARRRRHAARYARRLGALEGLALPAAAPGHVFHQYVVRALGRRDELRAHLAARRIGTEIYYPIPMHLQPSLSTLGGRAGDHPVAERLAGEALALPIFPELGDAEVDTVADSVLAYYAP